MLQYDVGLCNHILIVISIFGSNNLQTYIIELKQFLSIFRCTVGLEIF